MADRTGKIEILIVDDLEFMRGAIKEILFADGHYIIDEAENGQVGVQKFLTNCPDIVLMDITMPVMDGIKALAQIRVHDPEARVIMCSALGQEEYIMKAIRLGAKDFIVKPFRPERITSAIRKVLQKR